jgi:type I restriction enzyme S subunit
MSESFQKQFKEGLSGLIGGVSLSKIKAFDISFPSLYEQQRIVAILDQAFADIEKARANAEKNLKNARELFDSYLNQVFSQRGKGWVEKKLDDILLSNPRNGWSPPANNHAEEGTPVLTLSAVTGFEFKSSMIKYTSAPTKKDASYWVSDGDLLMTRSNTSRLVGHVAIAYGITSPTIYPDIIIKLNLDNSLVDSKFMYYQLRSPKLRKIISTSAHGANPTMKKLNQEMIKSFPINIASINQQKKVAGLLDGYYTETKQMETLYREKIKKLEELKKSLLQKAFSGELTKAEGQAA